MPSLLGPVVTNVQDVTSLNDYLRIGKFSAVKVIAGWGLSSGPWTQESRKQLLDQNKRVIVRTLSGDPSYMGAGGDWLPRPEKVLEEIAPWVTLRDNIWIEIGNEPDVAGSHQEELIWEYCWYAKEAVKTIRSFFPKVRIISPAVRLGEQGWRRWMDKLHATVYYCDTVGLHVYGARQINHDDFGQLESGLGWCNTYFPNKTIAITELGINTGLPEPKDKMAAYRAFARKAPNRVTWSMFYHLCQDGMVQPEYHISQGIARQI